MIDDKPSSNAAGEKMCTPVNTSQNNTKKHKENIRHWFWLMMLALIDMKYLLFLSYLQNAVFFTTFKRGAIYSVKKMVHFKKVPSPSLAHRKQLAQSFLTFTGFSCGQNGHHCTFIKLFFKPFQDFTVSSLNFDFIHICLIDDFNLFCQMETTAAIKTYLVPLEYV